MLKKKIGIWVDIPCVDNVGSCTYSDVCSMLPSGPCPPAFQRLGVPCHCPFPVGTYKLPPFSVDLKVPSNVPGWLSDGDFQLQATVNGAGGQTACIKVEVALASH